MARCLIGLGSNLGDRRAALSSAVAGFERDDRLRFIAGSRWHETKPVGGPNGQMNFLNGAVLLETALAPAAVLVLLLDVEAKMGRTRKTAWGPRVIDLDLLLYDDGLCDGVVVQTDRLTVPHPRMAWRRFVLAPAAEIAGEMVHAGTGWTIARLLHHLDTAHNYVAIAGPIGVGKTWLAQHIAAKMPAGMPVRIIAEQLDARRLKRFYDNPAGTAWAMELEFLEQRSRLLAAAADEWTDRRKPAVSDFWFDQSAAFASVWLGEDEFKRFHRRWQAARANVVQPRLTVVLSEPKQGKSEQGGKPGDWLMQRVRGRGREYETCLSGKVLHRIECAVARQADEPGLGPVLRLSAAEPEAMIDEAVAAIEGMQ